MLWTDDISVVVGLDFGTTYSGFTYCDKHNLRTHDSWPGDASQLKTNTVLLYDEEENVDEWGQPALSKSPSRRRAEVKPVKLFKLHLGDLQDHLKPSLAVDYKKAVTDYFREIGKLIEKTVMESYPEINFLENVLLVLTVPAEFTDRSKAILRECVFKANLIKSQISEKLQFTTEPEAAAIYCMKNTLREHNLNTSGTSFMIVDCGGGTVDLTTRRVVEGGQLGEITERAGDYCGSTFVELEFINYLRNRFGESAMNLLEEIHYGQMQYMIQNFCDNAKIPFKDDPNFHYIMNLQEVSPALLQYLSDDVIESLEDEESIRLDYEDIKSMFDPVVNRILTLIQAQLAHYDPKDKCSAMFLVGGFSQSEYLQTKIKEEFREQVENISVPTNPIAAVSRGAALYGISFLDDAGNYNNEDDIRCIISSRVLKFTYGVEVFMDWCDDDPEDKKQPDGTVRRFHPIAMRGDEVSVNEAIIVDSAFFPYYSSQTVGHFLIYYTRELDVQYIEETRMEFLGILRIDLPDTQLGRHRPLSFGLKFGKMEITAVAKNDTDGQNYQIAFDIETEN